MGHRIDAKIFPKAPSEKAQTTVSENTCTFPKIDVFRMAISSLLAPTGNNERASFLVHQVPHTSATVLRYRRMFTQFSLRVSASEYTCRPMIANLLYYVNHQFCTRLEIGKPKVGSVIFSSSAWMWILVLLLEATHRTLISWNNSLASARIVMMSLGTKEKSEKPAVTIYIKNCRGWWLSRGGSSVFRALVAQSRRPELNSS